MITNEEARVQKLNKLVLLIEERDRSQQGDYLDAQINELLIALEEMGLSTIRTWSIKSMRRLAKLDVSTSNLYTTSTMKKVQITLELNEKIVKKIEKLTGDKLKDLLEKEINESGEEFIEMMGYDNI